MKWLLFTLPLMTVLTLGACDDAGPFDPTERSTTDEVMLDAVRAGSPALDVMTWNIYVGADLNQLLAGDPSRIGCGVADIYGDVLATDFQSRAVAIADQIEAHRPHVVGLNEVSTFEFRFGFFHDNLVFLDILMDELADRGMDYVAPVEARSTNFQITLPISYDEVTCADQDALSYTEYDVLLVRGDVEVDDVDNGNFAVPLPLPYGLPAKYSGWASVDIRHKDLPYRVFSTHLEPADIGPCTIDSQLIQVHGAQAGELMGLLDASPYPTILTGDLNSDASGCTTNTYPDLIAAGFADAWIVGGGAGSGFTSNQDDDLRNAASELFHRIDFILYRDGPEASKPAFQNAADVELVGEDPADRINTSFGYDVWPSDHAGVVANLSIAPGMGQAN